MSTVLTRIKTAISLFSHGNGRYDGRHENYRKQFGCPDTVRERVKVQRGWKSMTSQIAEGQRIHYNFVKPHVALEGMTPAQRAGIPTENKWSELLRNALNTQFRTPEENT